MMYTPWDIEIRLAYTRRAKLALNIQKVTHIDKTQQYAHRQPKPKHAYKNRPGRDPQAGHTKN